MDISMDGSTKKRSKYFTDMEKNILIFLVDHCRNNMDTRRFGDTSSTSSTKPRIWWKIANLYNAYPNVTQRSEKQLQKCWENIRLRRSRQGKPRRSRAKQHENDGEMGLGVPIVTVKEEKEEVDIIRPNLMENESSEPPQDSSYPEFACPYLDSMPLSLNTTATSAVLRNAAETESIFPVDHHHVEEDRHMDSNSASIIVPPPMFSPPTNFRPRPTITAYQRQLLRFKRAEHRMQIRLLEAQLNSVKEQHAMKMKVLQAKLDSASSQPQDNNP